MLWVGEAGGVWVDNHWPSCGKNPHRLRCLHVRAKSPVRKRNLAARSKNRCLLGVY